MDAYAGSNTGSSIDVTVKKNFLSDNASGVHENVIAAITEANRGYSPAYGEDPWTRKASELIREKFDSDAKVLFCFGGTGANVTALSAVTKPFESILCAQSAHIWNNECGAVEKISGSKIVPIPDHYGKLEPKEVQNLLEDNHGVHTSQPRVLSLTQPTEWGLLYTKEELCALSTYAHDREMLVHVDGARYCNAVCAAGASLSAMGPECGIDILSFGGTKNGLLGAEAVIFFNRDIGDNAEFARKQATQLASKMRFIAAQFIAYFQDDLWFELSTQANKSMERLVKGCAQRVRGFKLSCPAQCNMGFPYLAPEISTYLQSNYDFHLWKEKENIARWVTSFDTHEEDINSLINELGLLYDKLL